MGAVAEAATFSGEFGKGRLQLTQTHRTQPKLSYAGRIDNARTVRQAIKARGGGGLAALSGFFIDGPNARLLRTGEGVQQRTLADAAVAREHGDGSGKQITKLVDSLPGFDRATDD